MKPNGAIEECTRLATAEVNRSGTKSARVNTTETGKSHESNTADITLNTTINRHEKERFSSRTSLTSSCCSDSDYRVTSLHDKPKPGKLTDFIPEVERNDGIF